MSIYETQVHQDLVQDVLNDSSTAYFPKWGTYMTFFFWDKDYVNFPECIESSSLEEFTEEIRIASAKYLELNAGKTKLNSNGRGFSAK